ncbi:MAG TPA: DUF3152 domain-containing protein, partial [Acidimicrobiia bacterium]|nr:DUF3152 domain-containing protein [Acidimicrobiia bacterium]
TLAEYRAMVVNHETGHWLGFGHAFCSGPGQPAPVMQQQSMSLQGCAFNSWPLPSERGALAARRGVPIVPAGAAATTTTTTTTRPAGPSPSTTTTRPSGPTTVPPPPTTATTGRAGRPASPAVLENRSLRRVPNVALRPWRRAF